MRNAYVELGILAGNPSSGLKIVLSFRRIPPALHPPPLRSPPPPCPLHLPPLHKSYCMSIYIDTNRVELLYFDPRTI